MGEYSPWRHFLHSFTGFVTRFTRRVSLVEQELLTLPEWGSCHSIFSFMCMFCRSLFVFCSFSFDHCVVCSSLIYGFWLPLWYTGTCFIQKIYAPSSSLLQGKHLPHFASIFFTYLWSFRWPNYIVTLPKYFSFRLPHLNINTGPPSSELDKNIQRKSHFLIFSHWNGYSQFRSVLNWFRN